MDPAFASSPLVTIGKGHRGLALCTRPRVQSARPRWRAAAVEAEPETTDVTSAGDLSKAATKWPTVFSVEEVMKILPHRYPFLLIDRVIAYEPGKRAVAIKNVSMNEPHFTGHFPDRPIMPGVLQVEALAQTGGIVMLQHEENPIKDGKGDFFFGGVDRVKWRKPVVPGDTLVMEMTLESFKPRFGIAKMAGK